MIVAEITNDHIAETQEESQTDREFHYNAMLDWWGWSDFPENGDWVSKYPKIRFKLYDDDGELYYEGWLFNDDGAVVQQFVLAWGEKWAGTTTITVYKDKEAGYVQEIG